MTVLEVIQKSSEFLSRKGVDSPRLQVELLLAHVLKTPRLHLYLNFERVLTQQEVDTTRELIRRRGTREPLQHLTGSVSFCGLELEVNRSVLIPRPETEQLAELAWTSLAKLTSTHPTPVALDYGTGSGCLAISLAHHVPNARIHALDISPEALATAQRNATRHALHSRIQFHLADSLLHPDAPTDPVDLLVSNPPYIPTAEIDTLEPEVRDHDPRMALDGDSDGLRFYRHLASHAAQVLRPGGTLLIEFGDGQEHSLAPLFQAHNWVVDGVHPDYTGRQRFLVAHQPR